MASTVPQHANGDGVVSIYNATSISEIQQALDQLGRQDRAVTAKLDTLVASQKDFSRQLTRLDLARAQLGPQLSAVRSISNGMLASAASTASRISDAVKRLDNEQAAVKETLQVVEQVAELKSCILGVHGAMEGTQDWELAATHVHRASRVPREVIESAFAEEIVPTAEVPDPPRVTLDNAAENLCVLFLREFEKAAKQGDGGRVTRFFKLFPLIARQDVGLDAYGRYVCGGVATRARANLGVTGKKEGFFYAVNLTRLFEHIAQIVDNHEPIVTRHYGSGMMKKVVERLQVEADLQGGIILDTWSEENQVSRKLTDVKSYAFMFLVQSFMPSQKPSLNLRSGSPMPRDTSSPRASEDEGINMKVIDALLSEMAMMLGRWALYTKFIAGKIDPVQDSNLASRLAVPALISHSTLQRKMADLLVEPFNSITTFFFRRSVEKAFQMDEPPADLSLNPHKQLGSAPPFITSAVDDVMYIFNQVIQRSLGTAQRAVVASVLPSISRVLNSDFYGMIQRKMRDESYPKPAVQGVALPPESTIISFLVLMNNLDVSTDYVRRIVDGQLTPPPTENPAEVLDGPVLGHLFPFNDDATFVENQIRNILSSFEAKTAELLTEAVEVLLRHVLRPRLRPVLIETFREVDYAPSDDQREHGHDHDADMDPVPNRFERGWSAFVDPIRRITTDNNFQHIHEAAVQHLARMLEKRVLSLHGKVNALGAIRLERDLTAVVAAAVRGGRYSLREHFARTLQMVTVLNMDDDEWDNVAAQSGDDGMDWKLGADERQRARNLLLA